MMWFVGGVSGLDFAPGDVWRVAFITRAQALIIGGLLGLVLVGAGIGLCLKARQRKDDARSYDGPKPNA